MMKIKPARLKGIPDTLNNRQPIGAARKAGLRHSETASAIRTTALVVIQTAHISVSTRFTGLPRMIAKYLPNRLMSIDRY
jgi:hypothetical protein